MNSGILRCLPAFLCPGVLLTVIACAGDSAPAPQAPSRGEAVEFVLPRGDGTVLLSERLQGRVTLIAFIATYDLGSQILARRLNQVFHESRPRINAVAVVLEPPRYAVLMEPFRASLGIDYEMVLADHETLTGGGPFGAVSFVPTLFALDPEGRMTARRQGPLSAQELQQIVAQARGR